MTITPASIVAEGYNFRSIVDAIERIILLYQPTVPRLYDSNYRGIVEALIDLGDILSGVVGSPSAPVSSSVGIVPPGWNSATNTYTNGVKPADGSFWFDCRQGRLFVAEGGEWYQTNGAESFVHIGITPPSRPVPGALFFDCRQGKTFVYVDGVSAAGEAGWYQANGGGDGGASLLGDLQNVSDSPLSRVAADDQAALLVRDGSLPLTDAAAYKATDHLDLGIYGTP